MIEANDVRAYTSFEPVKERTDDQLWFDILQASQDIFLVAGHRFTDPKYAILPDEVKLAFLKMTEYYALVNADESIAKGYMTEKLGDYSYTLAAGPVSQKFSLTSLLADHIQSVGENRVRFRMRGL